MFGPFGQVVCALALHCGSEGEPCAGPAANIEDFTHKQADGTYPGSVPSSLNHHVVNIDAWKHFLFCLIPVKMPKLPSCAACGFVSRAVCHVSAGGCEVGRGIKGGCAIRADRGPWLVVCECAAIGGAFRANQLLSVTHLRLKITEPLASKSTISGLTETAEHRSKQRHTQDVNSFSSFVALKWVTVQFSFL